MPDLLTQLREAAAEVAGRARYVRINAAAIPAYAASLPHSDPPGDDTPGNTQEDRAAFWLTLDAINFGSGWFPTLRKLPGWSGYRTIEAGIRRRFETDGRWSPEELCTLTEEDIAHALSQDPSHELMALFARSLNDLGGHVGDAGGFVAVVAPPAHLSTSPATPMAHPPTSRATHAQGSAAGLVEALATWECFADASTYDELTIPFLKRAQIAAADLHRAGVAQFGDLHRLTMFADNLVPHVLRRDGILTFDPGLAARIDREELITHGSPEEVEIRACALHAVELLVAQRRQATAAEADQLLWLRGQHPSYKASPRHRSRTTAY